MLESRPNDALGLVRLMLKNSSELCKLFKIELTEQTELTELTEPVVTGFGNSSSLLLDLDNILTQCADKDGDGFKCSEYLDSDHCMPLVGWCNPHTCNELAGKTATGKMIDPQMCSNQTFWEGKGCNQTNWHRCEGDRPGQCKI